MAEDVCEVRVDLGSSSYSIWIGQGATGVLARFLPERAWRKAAVLTDSNVGPLYAEPVLAQLQAAGMDTVLLEVPAGEASKSERRAIEVIDWLIAAGLNRSDVVVALGGGVVGDLAGFAASIYKRGTDLVQLPTTLMAQVDSSIGGKTAVNLPAAKNQIGTFHQPVAVVCDVAALSTLPVSEFTSGLAEVTKYSLITRQDWGAVFRADPAAVAGASPGMLAALIADCGREKAALVSADARDRGVRHYLNYGHTLGHALEAASAYDGTYSHGQAVSVGMVFAALVSEASGVAAEGMARSHVGLLRALGLPVSPLGRAPAFDKLAGHIRLDKKSAGDLVMVLLEAEGRPVISRGLAESLLEKCYQRLLDEAALPDED